LVGRLFRDKYAFNCNFSTLVSYLLLIDEYDQFANAILAYSMEDFLQVVSKGGFVRSFYEVLKGATQTGVVQKMFTIQSNRPSSPNVQILIKKSYLELDKIKAIPKLRNFLLIGSKDGVEFLEMY